MKILKLITVCACLAVVMSSCQKGYGCHYGSTETKELKEKCSDIVVVNVVSKATAE